MSSFAEQLRPFFPYLPPGVISARCLDQVLSVTRDLPGELGVGPFMFECALDDRPAADFSVAVVASRGDHAALFRPGSAPSPAFPPGTSEWRRIRHFARAWADDSSALSSAVHEAWLEFDVGLTGAAPSATPSVFFRLDGRQEESASLGELSRERLCVAEEGLAILRGRPLAPAPLATLTDYFASLPAGARILFVGAMLSRRSESVRLVTSGMELTDMVGLLQHLGLRGAEEHLARFADVARMADELWLAIDVDETGRVLSRIGLDCYCGGDAGSGNGPTWADLLSFLVVQGTCTGRKRDALLDTSDMSRRTFDERAWPESLRRIATILGPAGLDRMDLYVHHIKVIASPGKRLEAKAYLCGTYR